MTKEFVPYELAVKLKALGFEKECLAYYSLEKGFEKAFIYAITPYQLDLLVQAPLFQQVFRWFREPKNGSLNHLDFMYEYLKYDSMSYEEAELACLNKLIEIVETKSE